MSTATAATPAAQAPSLFRNRTFVAIWLGHTISIVGDGFHSVALGFWVLQATGSASAMATIMSTRVVVGILLGAVGGTVVDRTDRRRLMIAMNLVRFLTVGAIALLIRSGSTALLPVIGLTALTAVAAAFFGPAFQASLVNIVGKEELPKASGLLQVSNTLAQIAGPFLGGAVIAFLGGWAALSLDALSFLVAAVAILIGGFFPSPRREGAQQTSFWKDLTQGFIYIRKHPLARGLVVQAPVINFFGNAIGVLIPVIAIKHWMANSIQFGTLEAVFPAGFAIGAMAIMASAKKMTRRGAWMQGGIFVAGLLIGGIGLMPTITAALPFALLAGIALAFANVLLQISLQSEIEPEVQGRVFGTMGSLMQIASPLSMMAAGFLGDIFSPVLLIALCGGMVSLLAVAGYLLFPGIRQYQ
ncbi:MAG: MFS transporter [Bacillota bacterium]